MKKRGIAVFAAAVLFLGITTLQRPVTADAEETKKETNLVVNDGVTEFVLTPGEATQVHIPVTAEKKFIWNPTFKAVLPENAPFEIVEFDVYHAVGGVRYEDDYIGNVKGAYLTFAFVTKETAKPGRYDFQLEYSDAGVDGIQFSPGDFEQTISLTAVVGKALSPAELVVQNVKVSGQLQPGREATLSFDITNVGEITAKGIRLSADYSGGNLIPGDTDYTKKPGDLRSGESATVSLKVKLMEHVNQSTVLLPLTISYQDVDGQSFTADTNNILYLNVELPKEETVTFEHGTLLIHNVKQSPEKPKAGQKVTLTFDMENTGEGDYTDARLHISYTSNTGFEPVKAEPYVQVGTIPAGGKKSVTLQLMAGKEIGAGMHALDMTYDYKRADKEEVSGNVSLYVLNVQKAEEPKEEQPAVVSRPKLMVSEFSTSKDVIKSGEEFDFTFDVYNTNSEVAAKNIKITVTSEMFSVTKGSNSFFTQRIAPGQEETITINLKASAAAMTGSYPVDIRMEYEYDGMPAAEANGDGVVVTETKMLLIKENLRVSLENVMVGGWNTPYVNQPTQLAFSIYNMGKSALNNVYFTVEGDFAVANGSSYYYGTLQPGYPDYVEMDIMPLVAGEAKGVLTVHMEDSNGDEVTYTSDISGFISEYMEFGEFEEPGIDLPVDVPPMEEPSGLQMPKISLPVFIAILVILFISTFFITRGIRIACYKKKVRREE